MDSSKSTIADSRHRALTHNTWFIGPDGILERVFGATISNSDGRKVSTREIGEQHILEDFGGKFIPTAQDYLQEIEIKDWMVRGKTVPPSFTKIDESIKDRVRRQVNNTIPIPRPVHVGEMVMDGARRIYDEIQHEIAMDTIAQIMKQVEKADEQ